MCACHVTDGIKYTCMCDQAVVRLTQSRVNCPSHECINHAMLCDAPDYSFRHVTLGLHAVLLLHSLLGPQYSIAMLSSANYAASYGLSTNC
jgi:hypothetical protein